MELREVVGTSMSSHSTTKKGTSSPTDYSFQNLMNLKTGNSAPANHENSASSWAKVVGQKHDTSAVGSKDLNGGKKEGGSEPIRNLPREEKSASGVKTTQEESASSEIENEVKAEIADAKAKGTKDVTVESEEVEETSSPDIVLDAEAVVLLASSIAAAESSDVVEQESEAGSVNESDCIAPLSGDGTSANEVMASIQVGTSESKNDLKAAVVVASQTTADAQAANVKDVRRDWDSEKVLAFLDIRPDQAEAEGEIAIAEGPYESSEPTETVTESPFKALVTPNRFAEKTDSPSIGTQQGGLQTLRALPKEEMLEDAVVLKADVVVQQRSEVQVHFENMMHGPARPVMTQVTEAVRANFATLASGQVVEVQLNPEQLGKVELKLHIHKGVIEAEIKVENQQVKSAIESSMAELKQSLSQRGYEVKDVSVNVDSDGRRGGSQNGGRQEQREDAEGAAFVDLMEEEARKSKE